MSIEQWNFPATLIAADRIFSQVTGFGCPRSQQGGENSQYPFEAAKIALDFDPQGTIVGVGF